MPVSHKFCYELTCLWWCVVSSSSSQSSHPWEQATIPPRREELGSYAPPFPEERQARVFKEEDRVAPYLKRFTEGGWWISLPASSPHSLPLGFCVLLAIKFTQGCAFPSCTSSSQPAPESVSVKYSRLAAKSPALLTEGHPHTSDQVPLSGI